MYQPRLLVMIIFLLRAFQADSSSDSSGYIYVDDEKLPVALPEGNKDFKDFSGYFVELSDDTGCANNLTVNDVQEGETNANFFVPYINWYTKSEERLCTFDRLIENLQNISISHFILIVDKNYKNGDFKQISSMDYALYTPLDNHGFVEFTKYVSEKDNLRGIEVKEVRENEQNTSIPMSSMAILFVTVAFVTLMTVSIGWLVFYYAQRCRQRNMRERLQSRLCVAAKRAVSKLPTKTVPDIPKTSKRSKKRPPVAVNDNASTCSSSSSEDGDCCPVCLDLYKPREVIRILPCKHEFHKGCVDPWLFDHRTCPMCKLDILEHLGMPPVGDRLTTPSVTMQEPPPEYSENVSTRVDQEVQTDFVNQQPAHQIHTTVAIRISDDEIGPAPISSPSV